MTAATARKMDSPELDLSSIDLSSAQMSSQSVASQPVISVATSVDSLAEARFSSNLNFSLAQSNNPLGTVFQEEILRMWLDSNANHISISNDGAGNTNLRVINEHSGVPTIVQAISLDEKPTSISVSPSGDQVLLASGEMVTEYSITPSGAIVATFAYPAGPNQVISRARYSEDGVKISTQAAQIQDE